MDDINSVTSNLETETPSTMEESTEAISIRAKQLIAWKQKLDSLKEQVSQAQDIYDTNCQHVMNMLETVGIESIKVDGYTFYTTTKESVKTPKTEEDKRAFFDYLKSLGLFDDMISVNSQTLNSFYAAQAEEALKNGTLEFRMPGIEPPTPYKQLKLRKA